jgi:hypothetical protein
MVVSLFLGLPHVRPSLSKIKDSAMSSDYAIRVYSYNPPKTLHLVRGSHFDPTANPPTTQTRQSTLEQFPVSGMGCPTATAPPTPDTFEQRLDSLKAYLSWDRELTKQDDNAVADLLEQQCTAFLSMRVLHSQACAAQGQPLPSDDDETAFRCFTLEFARTWNRYRDARSAKYVRSPGERGAAWNALGRTLKKLNRLYLSNRQPVDALRALVQSGHSVEWTDPVVTDPISIPKTAASSASAEDVMRE